MKIQIASAVGTGPTRLAAFDDALIKTGTANYNLIRLSSVIPPGSEIEVCRGKIKKQPGEWGDRLYVVMAEERIHTPNTEAWSGIGWVQDKKTGKGLLVEHEGFSEATVKQDIKDSLKALMRGRNVDFGKINMEVVGGVCHAEAISALTIAVFQAEGWHLPL